MCVFMSLQYQWTQIYALRLQLHATPSENGANASSLLLTRFCCSLLICLRFHEKEKIYKLDYIQ
jgi:hypothetical protein